MLRQLVASTFSNIDTHMFAILDQRSFRDKTVLLVHGHRELRADHPLAGVILSALSQGHITLNHLRRYAGGDGVLRNPDAVLRVLAGEDYQADTPRAGQEAQDGKAATSIEQVEDNNGEICAAGLKGEDDDHKADGAGETDEENVGEDYAAGETDEEHVREVHAAGTTNEDHDHEAVAAGAMDVDNDDDTDAAGETDEEYAHEADAAAGETEVPETSIEQLMEWVDQGIPYATIMEMGHFRCAPSTVRQRVFKARQARRT